MLAKNDICKIISDGDGGKITIDILEFSLQQQEGNGIVEEKAVVFIMTLMIVIFKNIMEAKMLV